MKKIMKTIKKFKWLTLMCATIMVLGAIFLIDGNAQDGIKYNVADYQGETSYPTQEGKVFAGWYQDAACTKVYMETTGEAYAKFVDEKVLTVKKQMRVKDANATNTNGIRFLTSIDTRRFAKVVFSVEVPEQGKTYELEETVAYSSIRVDGIDEPQLAADVFGTSEAKYFVAHSLTGIPLGASDSVFRITPYWYTLDGKKVAGTPAAFTVDEALVSGSLFAETLTVNGVQLNSAVSSWDLSQASQNKIVGTNLKDSQVMWFAKKSSEAVVQTTITRKDTSETTTNRESQPLAGIVITDGINTNYIGIRASNLAYGGHDLIGIAGLGDPLATWSSKASVNLSFALNDNQLSMYVDGLLAYELSLQTVIPNAKAGATLAYGLVMGTPDGKNAELEFANIKFTTDSDDVDDYQNGRFTRENSAVSSWDLSKVDEKSIKGTDLNATQAMWFVEKTDTALIEFTATRLDTSGSGRESQPMAGLRVSDGINSGYTGIRASAIVTNGAWDHVIGRDLFATWTSAENLRADIAIALKDNQFHIYVDGKWIKAVNVSTVVPGAVDGAELALGLVMEASGNKAQMQFSHISYTTDVATVNRFLDSKEILIDYGTGLGDDLQYNSTLYGLNQSNDVEGADPGVFYVSKEQDATYGGYYYMYLTGSTLDDYGLYDGVGGYAAYAFRCYRSKDLYQWELCGNLEQGYSLLVDWSDWTRDAFWAPEVIQNPADGKYYMYFSAATRPEWGQKVEGLSSSSSSYDRLYLGVAVADTPVGPFDILYDTSSGYRVPTINFRTGCNTAGDWSAIDASPFIDDDGTLYLYFNKHTQSSSYANLKGVWGMKMNSMTTPDYSTVSYLARPNYTAVPANTNYTLESFTDPLLYDTLYSYDRNEYGINEAPFMTKHNGKYYLTYASDGFSSDSYSVHQAIGDSPLGVFTKVKSNAGNPVLDGSLHGNNYMDGTAHHSIVKNGDEMWIVYHRHNSTKGIDAGMDRSICADRLQFVKNSSNQEVLTANGPSMGLQWLPESISGFENLAKKATITVSAGSGQEYLTDTLLPYYSVARNRVMSSSEDVTITLKWDEAVSVSSLMIYNAYNKENAFSKVENIQLTLAGQSLGKIAVIPELDFPARYMSNSLGVYVPCAPAVAEFETLMVSELQFTIPADGTINLSEVVVLGNPDKTLTNFSKYESFSSIQNDSDVMIDGVLDENVWADKQWFTNTYLTNVEGNLPSLKATGFITEKGIYIASVVKDSHIVNDGQHSMAENSAFDFRIAVGNTSSKKAWQTYHIMIDMRGDVHTNGATNFKRVVNVEGNIATVEIFIPWENLGVDVTEGTPTEFSMFPGYQAVLENSNEVTDMGCALGITADDVKNYWKFDATGYQSGDWRGALVGDSLTGLTKIGAWDVSKEHEKVVSTYGASTKHTLFFRYMYDENFIAEATISKNGTIGSGNPAAGFFFLDTNGNTHTMSLDLTKYPNGGTLSVIKFGDTFRLYINGMLLKAETIADLSGEVFPALYAENAKVTFKDYSCKTISEAKLQEYLDTHIFAQEVTVNDSTISSVTEKWDITGLTNKVVTGYSAGTSDPLYFIETGNTALVQMTVTRLDDSTMLSNRESQPMAGISVSDGTTSGFIGIRRGCIVYGSTWLEGAIGKDLFTTWAPANNKAEIAIILKDNQFQFYVDGIFKKSVKLTDAIPGIQEGAEVAIGLLMNSEANNAYMQFSNVKYTTDANEVDAFIEFLKSIFVEKVQVNGTTVNSALDRWVYDAGTKSIVGTDTTANKFYMEPMYFGEIGTSMVLQTTITNVSSTISGEPFAGLYVTDGTQVGGFGILGRYVKYGQWLHEATDIGAAYLSAGDLTRLSVDFEVVLKDGYFYVYIDGVFKTKVALNSVVYTGTPSGDLAFGLTMNGKDVGANKVSMKFSEITFSTASADVEKFFLEKAGYAASVQVNGQTVESKLANWDYSDIINGNLRGTSALGCNTTPMYFAETGNAMLMKTNVAFASLNKEAMVGVYATDGTNIGFAGTRGTKILTSPGWYPNTDTVTWSKYYFAPSGWGGVLNTEMTIVYKDQYLYLFMDGVYGNKVPITNLISTATADTEFAFGLVICPESTSATFDATFSNTTFTTDVTKVNDFLLVDSPLFASEVSVNGKTVQSSLAKWTYDSAAGSAIGTGTTTTTFKEPIYFKETGNTMLLQTTITNVSNPIKNQPFVGLMINDGTNKGGFGIIASDIKYGQWLESKLVGLGFTTLTQWDSKPSVLFEVALKESYFYIYVDGVYVGKISSSTAMTSGTTSGQLAFGLTMRSETGASTSIKFSNIVFTTNTSEVEAFLAEKGTAQ